MKMRFVLLAVAAMSLLGCGKSAVHFTQEGGPVAQTPKVEQTAMLRKVWRRDLGSGYRNSNFLLTPSIRDGRVYAAEPRGLIFALDAKTGKIIWKHDLDQPLAAGVGVGQSQTVVATREGEVVALDTEGGKIQWRHKMGTEVLARPVLTNSRILLRSGDGQVIGLDRKSGDILWRVRRSVPTLTVRGLSAPLVVEDVALIGFASGRLSAIDVNSGAELWNTRIFRARGSNEVSRLVDIDSDPYQIGERLVIAGFQARVSALSLTTRRIDWDSDRSTLRPLGSVGDTLLITADDGAVIGLDIHSGAQLWQINTLRGRGVSGPHGLHASGLAVVGDYKGLLYLIDVKSGVLVGRKKGSGGAVLGIFSDQASDQFITLSENGALTAWSLAD
ncbi:MAG TPA: outer membrane protein assembly factor BamB [Gammaproteobacteria bacterium]|nr:outer membrane protein assembly factor BamB [Gammaproteobacteria bacterium]